MTTSKGTIQGMACVTAADEKHQIIVHAQAFGMGQEQTTLKPMVEGIKKNFGDNIFNQSPPLWNSETDEVSVVKQFGYQDFKQHLS
jgi:hypothetical protein